MRWHSLVFLLSGGCLISDAELARHLDLDGDGYFAPEAASGGIEGPYDCDETNSAVNPGATEVCDGVDNNCDERIDDGADRVVVYQDVDGDGYGTDALSATVCQVLSGWTTLDGDCDDDDDDVYPGRVERCDGIDNDCDEHIDDGDDRIDVWADADHDGFGNADIESLACSESEDWVANDGDCDDDDDAIHPDAEEICDGEDNDCDDEWDEAGEFVTWYPDADLDEYGVSSGAIDACSPPDVYWATVAGDCNDGNGAINPGEDDDWYDGIDQDCGGNDDYDQDGDGYTSEAEVSGPDCDDEDGAINPGAAETCKNGIDDNCDGEPDPCELSGDVFLSSADLIVSGASAGDAAGGTLLGGDLNNDGSGDVVIASPGAGHGAAYVFYGPITGSSVANANVSFAGSSALSYSGFGRAMALLSDQNGDAFVDLVVGWNEGHADQSCKIFVFNGPLASKSSSAANATITAGWGGELALAPAGDLNGDGKSDLIIGGGSYSSFVHVLYGPLSGSISSTSSAAVKFTYSTQGEELGFSVAGDADLNGDGTSDILIGAAGMDDSGTDTGTTYAYYGPLSATDNLSSSDGKYTGVSTNDYAGSTVAMIGDVNEDGLDDFAIGARGEDSGGSSAGAVYVLFSPASGQMSLSYADAKLVGRYTGDQAGYEIVGGEDINGDAVVDIVISAPFADFGATTGGSAYIIHGPINPGTVDLADASAQVYGTTSSDNAGSSVSLPGDIDGDGFSDLVIGASGYDASGTDAGGAFLFFGSGM